MSDCFRAFWIQKGGTHTKMGGYPYQNTIKHSTVKTKINLISALNDRQNESTRKTQQQNKKKPEGKWFGNSRETQKCVRL